MRPLSRHLLIWLATVLLALLMAAVPVLLDGAPAHAAVEATPC